MSDDVLRISGLEVSYRGVPALRGVDLRVAAGKVVALVGASGSGKSTLGSAVGRLLPPTAVIGGVVEVLGQDVTTLPVADLRRVRRERLAYVFQNPITSLDPTMRIGRQFRLVLKALGRPPSDAPPLLSRVGLEDTTRVLVAYPHELSGGMAQRVAIALALVGEPSLVVADEPTSALDLDLRTRILQILVSRARESGAGLLLLSHDLRSVRRWADRVVVLQDGLVVEEGPVADVFAAPAHAYTRRLLDSVLPYGEEAGRVH